jgi:hypothetical protein
VARRAQPTLRFTLRGVSVLYRSRVIARCPTMADAQAFLARWRAIRGEAPAGG